MGGDKPFFRVPGSPHLINGSIPRQLINMLKHFFSALELHFTTPNTTGREGPTSNIGYKGSFLEDVKVTNGRQEWSVPLTGWYYVDMCGASGGDASLPGKKGGKGARVNGTVRLEKGTKLMVLVGQQGGVTKLSGGGGGGSFNVFSSNSTPLSIAGGGAGASNLNDGGPGQAGEAEGLKNGIVGHGGLTCVYVNGDYNPAEFGGPGGGFWSDGKCCQNVGCNGMEGKSFVYGGRGGRLPSVFASYGGFGGGGSAGLSVGGGGGGYSGGSFTGDTSNVAYTGGGGSFVPSNHGNEWSSATGACDKGDGYVRFRFAGEKVP